MRQINKENSGAQSRYSTCDWFYHAPLKQPEKPVTTEIPLSQIPGLSEFAEHHNDLGTENRKKWIRDTDSEYVKLAKQGGRPDLLKHYTPAANKSHTQYVTYAAPDWYVHEELATKAEVAQPSLPSYMIHEEFKPEHPNNKYESKRGPFDYDVKTVWQREAEDNEKENKEERKVKLPAIKPKFQHERNTVVSKRVPPTTTTKEDHVGKKVIFPPMPVSKNNDPVNFSKLMSNGYVDERIQQNNDWEKKGQQKSKNNEKNKGSETSQPE
ncbi:uncharacterized protein C7orf57 homolog isoform X2 [Rhinatrema bivittatum]|uniref:uncharacterized protein C7orf57 homolog isoform X2 n=1 Tax=Rhinatrema bivittatum TaxID=194408 RepID=UPI001129CE47|nr:uncharacterized protein C7orf57 homolog isoform X2 [Rhinatrema bivittatum]